MTRAQIVAITRNAVNRVLTNKIAMPPIEERHLQRLAELKRERYPSGYESARESEKFAASV
jgi:hypothetical protein